MAAAAAGDEAAQGEVLADILLRRSLRHTVAAILHRLPCRKAHQRLVLALYERQTPRLMRDMARIDRPREQFADALEMHFPLMPFRPNGLRFKKALHLGKSLEAPRCVAFKRLGDDGGKGFVAHQYLAVPLHLLIAIADRRRKHPISVHDAGAHAVLCLLGVLLALMLRDGGQQVFDQGTIGILAELNGGAFKLAPRRFDGTAQMLVGFNIARQSADVVDDDDDMIAVAVGLQEVEHFHDAGAFGDLAGLVLAEHLNHFITAMGGIFAAPRFLTVETVAFRRLLGIRHAAINHRPLLLLHICHGHADESSFPRLSAALGRKALVSLCCLSWVSDDPTTDGPAVSSSMDKASTCRTRSTCCTGSSPKARSTKLCMICQTAKSNSALRSSGMSICAT
nr:hypothetical protein [Shinella sp. JR1-6]